MSSFALAKVYPLREGSQFPAGATKQRGAGWTTRRPASAAADSSHWHPLNRSGFLPLLKNCHFFPIRVQKWTDAATNDRQ